MDNQRTVCLLGWRHNNVSNLCHRYDTLVFLNIQKDGSFCPYTVGAHVSNVEEQTCWDMLYLFCCKEKKLNMIHLSCSNNWNCQVSAPHPKKERKLLSVNKTSQKSLSPFSPSFFFCIRYTLTRILSQLSILFTSTTKQIC